LVYSGKGDAAWGWGQAELERYAHRFFGEALIYGRSRVRVKTLNPKLEQEIDVGFRV